MQFASLLHSLMMQSSWGFGLYSSRRNLPSRVVGQQTAKTIFKLFNVQSYIIFGLGGRWGIKNYQETKRGAELILLLRTGGGVIT